MKARKLNQKLVFCAALALALSRIASANGHGSHDEHASPEAHAAEAKHAEEVHAEPAHGEPTHAESTHVEAEHAETSEKLQGKVVAMNATRSKPVHSGELITVAGEPQLFVSRDNFRIELSPKSVAEFDDEGQLRLLRGSAMAESKSETNLRTAGARVEFVGKAVVSYDYLEKSTSAFVLEGEARIVNPHRDDSSLRLPRFRGATLVVGGVVPQLIRQLDVGAVSDWLKGYAWPEARRKAMLRHMPGQVVAVNESFPEHLEETKIEDYFSSIDTADEMHQPDYYEKKFDDPDKVVAEQNSVKSGKVLSPEEAALISLPKTQIDLGFELGPEFLTPEQKKREVASIGHKAHSRGPASISAATKAGPAKKKAVVAEHSDPDVAFVLSRLRQVRAEKAEISHGSAPARAPASAVLPIVPDPVYDYSQNF